MNVGTDVAREGAHYIKLTGTLQDPTCQAIIINTLTNGKLGLYTISLISIRKMQ